VNPKLWFCRAPLPSHTAPDRPYTVADLAVPGPAPVGPGGSEGRGGAAALGCFAAVGGTVATGSAAGFAGVFTMLAGFFATAIDNHGAPW